MKSLLHLDYETASELDLGEVGLDRYINHPSTRVLMASYAIGDGEVRQWFPHLGPAPADLMDELNSRRVAAWNAGFERAVTAKFLGVQIPDNRLLDVMIWSRGLSFPGSLAEACTAVGIKPEFIKDAAGDTLITFFCEPALVGEADSLFGPTQAFFRDWDAHPREWEQFCSYGAQDVRAERELLHRFQRLPLPEQEQLNWELDQEINRRGIAVDLDMVRSSLAIANRHRTELHDRMIELSGVTNPNSIEQVMKWAKTEGYPFSEFGKFWVRKALTETYDLSPACREVLELRQQAAKSSTKKLEKILLTVGEDGRLRNQFSFLGASRAGRWSGSGVQFHNLPRPSKAVEKNYDRAVELLVNSDYDALLKEFGSPTEVAVSCIRSVFVAAAGHRLVVCDLSAIENRVLGWIAGCDSILDVFRTGADPYIAFAARMFAKPYADVTKDERTLAKPAVLGCGYALSGGKESQTKDGDTIREGLWGYAQSMGIEMTQKEAHQSVDVFRSAHPEVPQLWKALDLGVVEAMKSKSPVQVGKVVIERLPKVLRIVLPSGRSLHYLEPKIVMLVREYDGRLYKKPTLEFSHLNPTTYQWGRVSTYGGKITENLCQAFARDILANGMQLASKAGFPIVAHVHDELIAEVPDYSPLGLPDLRVCMSTRPEWAPDLPLDADGFETHRYRK